MKFIKEFKRINIMGTKNKTFGDLKVGHTVYILIHETVVEHRVTDIRPHHVSFRMILEVEKFPYIVPRDKDYALIDKEFIFANKEALIEALQTKVRLLNGYIEKYS